MMDHNKFIPTHHNTSNLIFVPWTPAYRKIPDEFELDPNLIVYIRRQVVSDSYLLQTYIVVSEIKIYRLYPEGICF